MKNVMFMCPITREPVVTGISEAQYVKIEDTTAMRNPFTCSSCGLTHAWYKAEAWLETPPAGA
jgi:hypothetical protein